MVQQGSSQSAFAELGSRLLFLLFGILVFRLGVHVPVPGIDVHALARLFGDGSGSLAGLFNMFSGGAFKQRAVFALGVMPYISASIIMQLMSVTVPKLEALKKEGDAGRRKITQYTRYGTVVLASFQALGLAKYLSSIPGVVLNPGYTFFVTTTLTLVTGTLFLMWLGEQMTERGIGNGVSLIIFASIISRFPEALSQIIAQVHEGQLDPISLIVLAGLVAGVTYFVVYMERAQRRIPIHYAKRQQGRKLYAAQNSHLPLKINMSGVIPPIFASSIILFPQTISSWFGQSGGWSWLNALSVQLGHGQPLYMILFVSAIVFFCFFYTALVFNSKETAQNLKKSGAFIPSIRPGEQTGLYIDKVLTRLTLVGACYLASVALLPEFLIIGWHVPFYFGGTSLLIVVVVLMDLMAQVQALLLSDQYGSLMKRASKFIMHEMVSKRLSFINIIFQPLFC